jgi:phosphoribosylanthranilate isomerase
MSLHRTATWVKVCGTTNLLDAQLSVAAGADALGFIFAHSRRQIEPATAKQIVAATSGEVECIGVFVNASPERVAEIAEEVGLSGVQLHGDEGPGMLAEFRRTLGQRKIIKTLQVSNLQVNSDSRLEEYLELREVVDAILLDSGSAQQRGGTGATFDWESTLPIASQIRERMPLIIAGGLTPENVARAIELFQPWGVDVVSGVEGEPGRKDETKLREFVSAVRQHTGQ